jgi:carbon monoxide dehydrogenase subunit G
VRFIKLGIISVIGLFAVVTAISLLFPSTVIVSRTVNISSPRDSVLPLVNNMHNWKRWIQGMDQSTVKIFSDTEADMSGTKVVINNISDTAVTSLWQNKQGKWMISSFQLFVDSIHSTTIVNWQFQQQLRWYPWEKFASMMNEKIIGPMMETNLSRLKSLAERN